MTPFTTPSADGTELAGRHWPKDTPKAVMALVHGFGEHSGRYWQMAEHLNANEIAVVALDLHGHGNTPGRRGGIKNYEDFRADLAALLAMTRQHYPETPLVLYGHSMGGGIVLDYGLHMKDSLPTIASAPLILLTTPVPKILRFLVKVLAKVHPKGSLTTPIDSTRITNLPEEQVKHGEDELRHGTMSYPLAVDIVEVGKVIAAQAASWDQPLLLMHSKADQLTSFEASKKFSEAAKQTEFHGFETSQHEMHNDAPRDKVYALMTEFILRQANNKADLKPT